MSYPPIKIYIANMSYYPSVLNTLIKADIPTRTYNNGALEIGYYSLDDTLKALLNKGDYLIHLHPYDIIIYGNDRPSHVPLPNTIRLTVDSKDGRIIDECLSYIDRGCYWRDSDYDDSPNVYMLNRNHYITYIKIWHDRGYTLIVSPSSIDVSPTREIIVTHYSRALAEAIKSGNPDAMQAAYDYVISNHPINLAKLCPSSTAPMEQCNALLDALINPQPQTSNH